MRHVERTATVQQEYAQRQIVPGQRFDVEDQDVAALLALGRIKPEKGESGYVEQTYLTRDMKQRRKAA